MLGLPRTAKADVQATVTPDGAGDVGGNYQADDYVLTATGYEGYEFDHWSYDRNGTAGTSNSPELALPANELDSYANVVAHFKAVYPVWVGDTRVTSANQDDVLGDGTVCYVPATGAGTATLTLSNATINEAYSPNDDGDAAAIYAEQELTIQLEGNNSIVNPSGTNVQRLYGIWTRPDNEAPLTITGTGSLDAEEQVDLDWGIYVQEGTLSIEGGDITFASTYSCLTSAYGMTITGDDTHVTTTSADGSGLESFGGTFAIDGGTVSTTGRFGITAGNLAINGGNVTAIGSDNAIIAYATNAIPGAGWTNEGGTEGKAAIPMSSNARGLAGYKKVMFPVTLKTHKITRTTNPSDGTGGTARASVYEAAEGSTVQLTATPKAGYDFGGWSAGGVGAKIDNKGNPNATLTMGTTDVHVNAYFPMHVTPKAKYTVTISGGNNASPIGGSTSQTILEGSVITPVTYTAIGGYHFDSFQTIQKSGITAKLEYGQITVSGTPTANVSITLPDAVANAKRMTAPAPESTPHVSYRTHVQRVGWQPYVSDGAMSGTTGRSFRLEGIQIVLVKKGQPGPGKTFKGITQRYTAPFRQKGKK